MVYNKYCKSIAVSYPYLPASVNVVRSKPKPIAVIWARSSTACFMQEPHFSNVVCQVFLNGSTSGITLGAFVPGKAVLYGGGEDIRQKNRHLGSGLCPDISRGLSEGSSRLIISRHGSCIAHTGFSVFSRVTPT